MAFNGLSEYIEHLEQQNELIRVKEYVNPELEVAEITDRVSKSAGGGKALLFENTGTSFPLLINAMGSEQRMAYALGAEQLNEPGARIDELFQKTTGARESLWEKMKMLPLLGEMASWMPKTVTGKGVCQEVIHDNPDLGMLPVLKCWPADGGRFITLPCVHTKDLSGVRNVGMYRMQVLSSTTTGMHWHKHKTGARHYEAYKQAGKKMPIAVTLGGDPVYTYAATAPMPDNMDEYLLAGFLRKKKVKLVKCITQDIEVPVDADIVIEGYVDPEEELVWEGPFGDHTGFYSLADWYPRFHVTCITHRKDAVYPATIVGIPPMEDAYIGKATERIFLPPMKMALLPELCDMDLPAAGVAHNLTVVSIKKAYEGQALKVMNALWGAGQMMLNKVLVVVDEGIDIHNYKELASNALKHFNPATDAYFSQGPLDVLDHSSSKLAYGSKLCLDCTRETGTEGEGDIEYSVPDYAETERVLGYHPEITSCNVELLRAAIPVLIAGFKKTQKEQAFAIASSVMSEETCRGIKIVVLVDHEMDTNDLYATLWYAAGNVEPARDIKIAHPNERGYDCLIVDGTRKSKDCDAFERDWPNVVVSDSATIQRVDELWSTLGLGEFIPSPSLKFYDLVKNSGAVNNEQGTISNEK